MSNLHQVLSETQAPKAKFDLSAPQSTMLPRQDYGIDFYGVYKGEILVIVDLFTRETILTHLNNRTQDNVAKAIIRNIGESRDHFEPITRQN